MAQQQYYYAVWRRKTSTATIKLFAKWTGKFSVRTSNDSEKELKEYFGGAQHFIDAALSPISILGPEYLNKFDGEIVIRWGGTSWQADAIKLALARAIIERNSELRATLKPQWVLKRDPRRKERKKPGLKKARKAPTWSKR